MIGDEEEVVPDSTTDPVEPVASAPAEGDDEEASKKRIIGIVDPQVMDPEA